MVMEPFARPPGHAVSHCAMKASPSKRRCGALRVSHVAGRTASMGIGSPATWGLRHVTRQASPPSAPSSR